MINLESRFRISLKNLMICIDLLIDSREDRREKEQRKRENQMRDKKSRMREERKINKLKNQIESYRNRVYIYIVTVAKLELHSNIEASI